jgi:hypothetical protein
MVTKREGTTDLRGFLANGLSLAGVPVRLAQATLAARCAGHFRSGLTYR